MKRRFLLKTPCTSKTTLDRAYHMKKGLHGAPSTATIQPSGLGMDLDQPFLACSPDGLASIPTKESTLPCKADKSKGFFCNLGPSGTIALK